MIIKKILTCIVSLLITISVFCLPIYADEIKNMCDFAGRLNDIEADRLEDILDKASAESGFTLTAVITDNLDGMNSVEYAEKFYNENFSKYPQSIILLINYDTNNDIIFTGENASKYFNDSVKKEIISECISPNIVNGNVSDAVTEFAEKVKEISDSIPAQTQVSEISEETEKSERNNIIFTIIFGIIAGAICGGVVYFYVKSLYKRSENDFAVSNHKCTHKIDFNVKEDKFRREFVNKTDSTSET